MLVFTSLRAKVMMMMSIMILSLTAMTGSMMAQSVPSHWYHNGSTVFLVSNGRSREFFYWEPRPGLLQAGARRGAVLFSGTSDGDFYRGTAYIFNARCGAFPYDVNGPILDSYRRVVLRGSAPRIGANCQIVGYLNDVLEFTLSGN